MRLAVLLAWLPRLGRHDLARAELAAALTRLVEITAPASPVAALQAAERLPPGDRVLALANIGIEIAMRAKR